MLTNSASLLPVFLLIAVGFGLRKSNVIPDEHWRGIELLSFWILLPAILIMVLADSELSIEQAAPFALSLLLTITVICLIMWLARRPLNRWLGVEGPAFTSIFQTTTRWHGFIALAIAEKLFGAEGLAILAVAFVVMVPFINVVNILVLTTYAAKEPAPAPLIVKSLAFNPLIWGLVIGVAIRLSGLALPEVMEKTLDLAGRGALGVTLLALGAGLSWRAMKHAGVLVVLNTFVKLVLLPAIAVAFALMLGVTGMDFVILVLATAVPTAINGYVLARTMGGDAELYAATLTAQVIVSFVTLPLFLWWAMQFTALT